MPPDILPTQFSNAVVLWKQGFDTKAIAEKLSIKEWLADRWVFWHLDAKYALKGKPHGK